MLRVEIVLLQKQQTQAICFYKDGLVCLLINQNSRDIATQPDLKDECFNEHKRRHKCNCFSLMLRSCGLKLVYLLEIL